MMCLFPLSHPLGSTVQEQVVRCRNLEQGMRHASQYMTLRNDVLQWYSPGDAS